MAAATRTNAASCGKVLPGDAEDLFAQLAGAVRGVVFLEPGMLIAARAILGIAGATLAPSTLSLIRSMFENERRRAVAIGIWVTIFSTGRRRRAPYQRHDAVRPALFAR